MYGKWQIEARAPRPGPVTWGTTWGASACLLGELPREPLLGREGVLGLVPVHIAAFRGPRGRLLRSQQLVQVTWGITWEVTLKIAVLVAVVEFVVLAVELAVLVVKFAVLVVKLARLLLVLAFRGACIVGAIQNFQVLILWQTYRAFMHGSSRSAPTQTPVRTSNNTFHALEFQTMVAPKSPLKHFVCLCTPTSFGVTAGAQTEHRAQCAPLIRSSLPSQIDPGSSLDGRRALP